jgi:hypothetical protein
MLCHLLNLRVFFSTVLLQYVASDDLLKLQAVHPGGWDVYFEHWIQLRERNSGTERRAIQLLDKSHVRSTEGI